MRKILGVFGMILCCSTAVGTGSVYWLSNETEGEKGMALAVKFFDFEGTTIAEYLESATGERREILTTFSDLVAVFQEDYDEFVEKYVDPEFELPPAGRYGPDAWGRIDRDTEVDVGQIRLGDMYSYEDTWFLSFEVPGMEYGESFVNLRRKDDGRIVITDVITDHHPMFSLISIFYIASDKNEVPRERIDTFNSILPLTEQGWKWLLEVIDEETFELDPAALLNGDTGAGGHPMLLFQAEYYSSPVKAGNFSRESSEDGGIDELGAIIDKAATRDPEKFLSLWVEEERARFPTDEAAITQSRFYGEIMPERKVIARVFVGDQAEAIFLMDDDGEVRSLKMRKDAEGRWRLTNDRMVDVNGNFMTVAFASEIMKTYVKFRAGVLEQDILEFVNMFYGEDEN